MIDDEAAEAYEKYADDLIRFASMLVGPADSGDIVADAVLRVLSPQVWARVRDPRAYLFRAVLNEARSARRSTQRRLAREIRSAADGGAASPPTHLRVEVMEALHRLSMRQRAVTFLRFWEDLDTTEIAALLDVTTRTVQRELDAAQRRLEVLLQ